jgi:long-chain acyl-CoA synthetase
MKERFSWHPVARLVGDAPELARAQLQSALSGQPFRIGGAGPLAAGAGQFESLTSGSLAEPRRILRSMASWIRSFEVNAGLFGIGPGVRVAVLGGLEQSLALYGAVEALHLGAELHYLGGMRPDRQALACGSVDVVYATPAQLRLMAGVEWPNLSRIIVGGSKLDARLRADLAAMTPAVVQEFYGAAEASFISLAGPDAPLDSVGQPYPGVEIDLRGGQIWVRSPYVFESYVGAGSAVWDRGWLSVGEMGRIEAGYLYLSGRAGRMVTVADQNVFPEEMEAVMADFAGITRVAVLPSSDALRGVVLVAVVQGDMAQEAQILARARAAFGVLKAPRRLIWRQDWPMLASGKTDLRALQAWL